MTKDLARFEDLVEACCQRTLGEMVAHRMPISIRVSHDMALLVLLLAELFGTRNIHAWID